MPYYVTVGICVDSWGISACTSGSPRGHSSDLPVVAFLGHCRASRVTLWKLSSVNISIFQGSCSIYLYLASIHSPCQTSHANHLRCDSVSVCWQVVACSPWDNINICLLQYIWLTSTWWCGSPTRNDNLDEEVIYNFMWLTNISADIPFHLLVLRWANMLDIHVKVESQQSSQHFGAEWVESHSLVDCDYCIVDGWLSYKWGLQMKDQFLPSWEEILPVCSDGISVSRIPSVN